MVLVPFVVFSVVSVCSFFSENNENMCEKNGGV